MIYCDTSLLVAALVLEERSAQVKSWLRERTVGELCISTWTVTEVSAALALKLRTGTLPAESRPDVLTQWRAMQVDQLISIAVPHEAFDLAARFCDMNGSVTRAGDALHLAVASLGGLALATLDERMREGAEAVGVRVLAV